MRSQESLVVRVNVKARKLFGTSRTVATQQYIMSDLNGICTVSDAHSISNLGTVVGSCQLPGQQAEHAVMWDQSGLMTDLSVGNIFSGYAFDINDSGTVVHNDFMRDFTQHAFVWTSSTGSVDIGSLGGDTYVWGVNNHDVAVGAAFTAGDTEEHAFKWSPSDGFVDMGTFGGLGAPRIARCEQKE